MATNSEERSERMIDAPSPNNKKPKTDNESAKGYSLISLLDTITSNRISNPVRGSECDHLHTCFDGTSILSAESQQCPICNKSIDVKNLVQDPLIEKILKETPADVLTVKLYDDDSWEPYQEAEDDACEYLPLQISSDNVNNNNSVSDSRFLAVPRTSPVKPAPKPPAVREQKTVPPFRIRLQYQKIVKYVTLPSANFQELYITVLRKFPNCVRSNDDSSKIQIFILKEQAKFEIKDSGDVSKLVENDLLEITITSSTTSLTNFPSNLVRWFWWDDDQKWKTYSKTDSDLLEQAFTGNVDKVNLVNGLYVVSISKRTQTRPNTGKVRKIVRGSWFWVSDNGAAVPYDEKFAAKLEAAYQEIQSSTDANISKTIPVDTQRYCLLKKSSMKQFNRTGTAQGRVVKRGF